MEKNEKLKFIKLFIVKDCIYKKLFWQYVFHHLVNQFQGIRSFSFQLYYFSTKADSEVLVTFWSYFS